MFHHSFIFSYFSLLSLLALWASVTSTLPSVQAAPTAAPMDVDENSPIVYYHGTWTTSDTTDSNGQPNSYKSTTNPGDDFVFCFNGTSIEYYGVVGVTNAKFRVTLDGTVMNSSSLSNLASGSSSKAGGATQDGSSGFYNQSLLFYQDGLSNDFQHTFTITHDDESVTGLFGFENPRKLELTLYTVMNSAADVASTGPSSSITPSNVAQSPSTSPSDPAESSQPNGGQNKTGTIIGAVFGSVIGVAFLIVLGLWYIRRESAKARRKQLGTGAGTGTGTGSHSQSQGPYAYDDVKVAMPHLYNQFKSKLSAATNAKSGAGSGTGSQARSFPMHSINDPPTNPPAAIHISPTPMVPYQIPPPPPALLSTNEKAKESQREWAGVKRERSMSVDQASLHKDLPLTPPPSPPRGLGSTNSMNFPSSNGNAVTAMTTINAPVASYPSNFGSSYQNHPYAPFAHEYTRYRSNSQPSISSQSSHIQRDRAGSNPYTHHPSGAGTVTGTDNYIQSVSGHGSTTSLSFYPDATSADGLARSYTHTAMARPDSRASSVKSKRFSNQLFSR